MITLDEVLQNVAARLSESGHRDTCGNCMDSPEFEYECLLAAMTEEEYAIELAEVISAPAWIECHAYCDNSDCSQYGWAYERIQVRSDVLEAVFDTWGNVVDEDDICHHCGQVGGLRVSPDECVPTPSREAHARV